MLKNETVILRAIERDDLPALLAWRNNPDYRKFFREYRELNMDLQTAWYENKVLNDPRTLMFAIAEPGNQGRLLGACGLCYVDWVNRNADFSIYIGVDDLYIDALWAHGAARALIRYAFEELNLHRLWAEVYDFDEAKKKLFAALNFSFEGRHRQTHWSNGLWSDSLFYSLLVTDK
jgi:RimJ/RimL family protein N-acetyltransferase